MKAFSLRRKVDQRWACPVFIFLRALSSGEFTGSLVSSSAKVTGNLLPWSGNLHFHSPHYCFYLYLVFTVFRACRQHVFVQHCADFLAGSDLYQPHVERLKSSSRLANMWHSHNLSPSDSRYPEVHSSGS